ncbi:hypothetical protein AG1IA_05630 [Rhizoctonia solani AG-1 IA]|uniref:Uncharacterized protein n=1 Tax=Thanatephorus cucumeris (strain AG1-IA) TaxID=983506 RepID=L8WQE0_THACA|nr:hypothetical protein AG1IA_05630 [Rhizoctonia solani AG-1 IA]
MQWPTLTALIHAFLSDFDSALHSLRTSIFLHFPTPKSRVWLWIEFTKLNKASKLKLQNRLFMIRRKESWVGYDWGSQDTLYTLKKRKFSSAHLPVECDRRTKTYQLFCTPWWDYGQVTKNGCPAEVRSGRNVDEIDRQAWGNDSNTKRRTNGGCYVIDLPWPDSDHGALGLLIWINRTVMACRFSCFRCTFILHKFTSNYISGAGRVLPKQTPFWVLVAIDIKFFLSGSNTALTFHTRGYRETVNVVFSLVVLEFLHGSSHIKEAYPLYGAPKISGALRGSLLSGALRSVWYDAWKCSYSAPKCSPSNPDPLDTNEEVPKTGAFQSAPEFLGPPQS